MKIYHYDATTGIPLGTSNADESPLEPGVFLIPAHATTEPPPVPAPGKLIVWQGAQWQLINEIVAEQGESTPAPTLAGLQADTLAAIKAIRNRKETEGFFYQGKLFDSDERSVQRITAAVLAAQVVGASFAIVWTAADNTTIALDQAGMLGMPVALAAMSDKLHQYADVLKGMVLSASDTAALMAIDINAGWPSP